MTQKAKFILVGLAGVLAGAALTVALPRVKTRSAGTRPRKSRLR